MGFKDAVITASGSLGSINSFIKRDHSISVNNQRLEYFATEIDTLFKAQGIEEGHLKLRDEKIIISGRFESSGGGSFTATIVPNGFVWSENQHVIYFKLKERDFTLDNRFKNTIAAGLVCLCDFVFGKNFITEQMGKTDNKGNIEVSFDEYNSLVCAVVESILLQNVSVDGSVLNIRFSPVPKNALKHAKQLMSWWNNIKKEQ